ncbi:MAG: hypothetical protein KAX58_01645, partial [Aeromonadaceae bacterium]|nr:hypothetical protein [Aeromonadaceae bacterium]
GFIRIVFFSCHERFSFDGVPFKSIHKNYRLVKWPAKFGRRIGASAGSQGPLVICTDGGWAKG